MKNPRPFWEVKKSLDEGRTMVVNLVLGGWRMETKRLQHTQSLTCISLNSSSSQR